MAPPVLLQNFLEHTVKSSLGDLRGLGMWGPLLPLDGHMQEQATWMRSSQAQSSQIQVAFDELLDEFLGFLAVTELFFELKDRHCNVLVGGQILHHLRVP